MTMTRRSFIGASAAALGDITSDSSVTAAPRKRNPEDLIRVGLILGEYAHSTGWAPMINGISGDNTFPKRTGMVYTHVWHIERNKAEAFARQYGVETVVGNFDDMVSKVDGVIIDTIMQTPWVHKLAEPYLANGIPVFSDRPFSDAVWKTQKLIDLSRKNNTPFWSGSSLERMYQCIQAQDHNPPDTITGYETWSQFQPSFYCHGLHGCWWTHKITGRGIQSVSYKTTNWLADGGDMYTVHKDRGKGPYMGVVHQRRRENCLIWTRFEGSEQVYRYDTGHWQNFVYLPLLLAVQDMFYMGMEGIPESFESFLEKSKYFIAAFRSHLREEGGFVDLDGLDEDWAIGCPWGHPEMSTKAVYDAYTKLLGKEDGEIRPG